MIPGKARMPFALAIENVKAFLPTRRSPLFFLPAVLPALFGITSGRRLSGC